MEIVNVFVEIFYNNDKHWNSSKSLRVKPKTLDIFEDFAFFNLSSILHLCIFHLFSLVFFLSFLFIFVHSFDFSFSFNFIFRLFFIFLSFFIFHFFLFPFFHSFYLFSLFFLLFFCVSFFPPFSFFIFPLFRLFHYFIFSLFRRKIRFGMLHCRVYPAFMFFMFSFFLFTLKKVFLFFLFLFLFFLVFPSTAFHSKHQYQSLTVSCVVGASWRCGVLTTQGGMAGVGLGHHPGREHKSTPREGWRLLDW